MYCRTETVEISKDHKIYIPDTFVHVSVTSDMLHDYQQMVIVVVSFCWGQLCE